MSLKPGIGADAMWDVASATMQFKLKAPHMLRHGSVVRPLGRYLKNKLMEYAGEEKEDYVDQLLPLVRAFAWEHARSVSSVYEEVNSAPGAARAYRGTI
jgi:hypothetical protein